MLKTIFLLVFLLLNSFELAAYTENSPHESLHHYIRNTAIVSSPTTNQHDGLGTAMTVYTLIIGVYILYWFKQKV